MDAQSLKNTDMGAMKGDETSQKVSGIKHHIAIDTQRLQHAIAVKAAEVTDRKVVYEAR